HLDFPHFYEYLQTRVRVFPGDLTAPQFGLSRDDYDRLIHTTDSVLHCAASLNRKSEKSCLNVNLRGTLEVLLLAQKSHYYHGLRRFTLVSTVAVAGKRQDELVTEDRAIEWDRSDYDPYARTKKFCEHMTRQLLPDIPITIFRPSIVLGDSRYPQTTQFDMVRARVWRRAAESIHAVSHLEYSFRQHARDQRAGAQADAIFAIQLSAVAIQSGYELYLSLPGLASQGGRVGRMMDFILEAWVSSSIEAAKLGWVMGKGQHWEPGEKLKLLFAGYNGTRNMGSDVRVSEMLRQIRHILGAERVEFS